MPVEWDYESRTDAYDQMRDIAGHDPDAAVYLSVHLGTPAPADAIPRTPYDPMALYARMAKYYRFRHEDMQSMDYRSFFGYVREANLMAEEERRQIDNPTPRDPRYQYDA